MAMVEIAIELNTLLEEWEKNLGTGANPVPTLTRQVERNVAENVCLTAIVFVEI